MGGLDPDLHHPHVHQNFYLPIPPAHRGGQEIKNCVILIDRLLDTLLFGLCIPLPWHLQTFESVLGCGSRRHMLFGPSIREYHYCAGRLFPQTPPMALNMLTTVVLSIVSDLICAAFPILFLRNLQISIRTKIALFVLMGLGVM